MTRLDKIIAHLKTKGAQYNPEHGDRIVTNKFTEHIFRNLTHSVRIREWPEGLLEVLIIHTEICPGMVHTPWHKDPPMEMVLQWIDEATSAYPPIPEESVPA